MKKSSQIRWCSLLLFFPVVVFLQAVPKPHFGQINSLILMGQNLDLKPVVDIQSERPTAGSMSKEMDSSLLGQLSLELQLEKQEYRIGEPVRLTCKLWNSGSKAYWVSKHLFLGNMPGSFALEVFDASGRQLRVDSAILDFPSEAGEQIDLFQWIRETRLLMAPGNFIGFTEQIHLSGGERIPIGTYRIQAIYGDTDLRESMKDKAQIEQALKQAVFPLWYGKIRSQTIKFRVML